MRQPADWMLPVDDAILELFHSTDLVLTPSIIAYSREKVNRRLVELVERGFVTRVRRGKYRITALGTEYLDGDVSSSLRIDQERFWPTSSER